MSETGAFASALDKPGDICHYKGIALAGIYDPEVGTQCGEMIIGDLGVSFAYNGEESGFTYIRETDKPHVCEQLQLKSNVVTLAV